MLSILTAKYKTTFSSLKLFFKVELTMNESFVLEGATETGQSTFCWTLH
jgi:hypothetical protein